MSRRYTCKLCTRRMIAALTPSHPPYSISSCSQLQYSLLLRHHDFSYCRLLLILAYHKKTSGRNGSFRGCTANWVMIKLQKMQILPSQSRVCGSRHHKRKGNSPAELKHNALRGLEQPLLVTILTLSPNCWALLFDKILPISVVSWADVYFMSFYVKVYNPVRM